MIGRKVLFIDTDVEFLQSNSLVFRDTGAQVIMAQDAMEGIGKMLTHRPDLIILGTMLHGRSSLQVYKKIRQFSNTPLIMLSVLDQEQLMLQGWEPGADDFLTKPITPEILLAHARAVVNRSKRDQGKRSPFKYDDGFLKIDVEKHRVTIRNKRINLTPVEFRLLTYLASNPDRVLSFDQILVKVWGIEREGNNSYVYVYISHLRSKIESDEKAPRYIQSIHGVGYIFERQSARATPEKVFGELATS